MIQKTVLPLLLLLPMFVAGQSSTYYQNQQYNFPSVQDIDNFGMQFTAQDGSEAEINWIFAAPVHACNNQTVPPFIGWVMYTGSNGIEAPCAQVALETFGPTIKVGSCSGPGSVHVEFGGGPAVAGGGAYDASFTYFLGGRWHNSCVGKSLTGTLTLNK